MGTALFSRRCCPLVVAVVIGLGAVPCRGAEPDQDDFAELRERAVRLSKRRDVTAAERVAMIAELAGHETAAAARLIVSVGLACPDAEARSAARAALARSAADKQIRSALLADYRARAARGDPVAFEEAIALLAAEADDQRGEFRTLLDRTPPPAIFATVAGICSACRGADDATAVAALRSVAMLGCFNDSFACRRGVIATVAGMNAPAALEMLVDMLPGLRGEVRGDVIARLTQVSGQHHGTDAKAWRAWLDANPFTGSRLPSPGDDGAAAPGPEEAAVDDSQSSYYGIPIYADRVVFVIDNSGSMEGDPLQAAKRELVSAILGLPETTLFTVVFFNTRVGAWQRQLVPADDQNKQAAVAFVSKLAAEGSTATCDAVEAAFRFDTEAIFFLSDGMPSCGRITEPDAIVDFATRLNAGRYVSVNTISIMGGAAFLENLAKANHGRFRAVDQ